MDLNMHSTVRLPKGVEMPVLGLGTFQVPGGAATERVVLDALEIGYRLIDTAKAYGNEADVGGAVQRSGVARGEIFLTTKVWVTDEQYDATLAACRQSLRALQTDYLDLYLIHWPVHGKWPDCWRAMEALLRDGLCRAIGVSNFEIHHLEELRALPALPPAVNQVEFSPFLYRKELLDYCTRLGIRLEGYSPLTRGAKFRHPTLRALAAKYHKTPAQILIRWPLQHGVITIPKASSRQHLEENADVFDFEISSEDMATLDTLNEDYYTGNPAWRAQFE